MAERLTKVRMPRGIFAKLLSVFLLIGLVPVVTMGVWVYSQARDRMTSAVIEHWLARISMELSVQIDQEVARMSDLVYGWSKDDTLTLDVMEASSGSDAERTAAKRKLFNYLANHVKTRDEIDLVLIVDREGTVLAGALNNKTGIPSSAFVDQDLKQVLKDRDDGELEWINGALSAQSGDGLAARGWHLSHMLYKARGVPYPDWEERPRVARAYSVGYASALKSPETTEPAGVLVVLFNCSRMQAVLNRVTDHFQHQREESGRVGRYATGYPFLFANDGNTVVAHRREHLVGTRLKEDHHQEAFYEKLRKKPYGSIHYEYPAGNSKIAGFARCKSPSERGFGWYVGVGIDDKDIYSDVLTLRNVVILASGIVTALVIAAALLLSHRLTKPILHLADHTRTLASGNLEARVAVKTGDEIEVLADAFNGMANELSESNKRLIIAEKDAAWREMARQVAHEIKNPLTPIMLSAQHMMRAHADRHPAFDEIMKESTTSIIDQCKSLKKIASDFMRYAKIGGGQAHRENVVELASAAVKPYQARDDEASIDVIFEDATTEDVFVSVDRDDLQRVLLNLINNGLESMQAAGGTLSVRVSATETEAAISVIDTGCGIPTEHRAQLFEPSFSTRTGGTGLGLAIAQKLVESQQGHITVESEVGVGTKMTVHLPRAPQSDLS